MAQYNKFPAGEYVKPDRFDKELVQPLVARIEDFPHSLEMTIRKLDRHQIMTKTLPGVWSVAQVVHHLADSHMNAFIRMKLTLTEENPTVKPYKEDLWANLADGIDTNLEHSLGIIRGVHKRMGLLLRSLNEEDLKRTYYHPEYKSNYILGQVIALYDWHGRHHLGFIQELIKEKSW